MSVTPSIGHVGITLRLRREIRAARETVFRAWTDPEALKGWWCPDGWVPDVVEVDLRVGGSFSIGMRKCAGGPPVFVHGEFIEVHPPERLVYTWRWENAFEGMPTTRVVVQFLENGGVTEVLLAHENLPEIPICLLHRAGWMDALARMTAFIGE